MKYCVRYYKNFRYNDIIDEVIFDFNIYKNNFLEEISNWKKNQRIIINLESKGSIDDIPFLKLCIKEHNNFAVCINLNQKELEEELKKEQIPFFYNNYADTVDEIYGMIKRGVSDVYITESLAFNFEQVGKYCKEKNVIIRIIPNIAQYKKGFKEEIPDPCKFFVRPEDTELYNIYDVVFELIASQDRLSIVYEIYKNRQWSGDLKQLIIGLNDSFFNSGLVPHFGPERLKCGQKCMQEKCNLCQQMKELSDAFVNNKLEIKREKHKEWKNETRSYQEAMRIVEKSTSNNNDQIPEE